MRFAFRRKTLESQLLRWLQLAGVTVSEMPTLYDAIESYLQGGRKNPHLDPAIAPNRKDASKRLRRLTFVSKLPSLRGGDVFPCMRFAADFGMMPPTALSNSRKGNLQP